ncbi:hypothetical protein BGZ61DRAFT_465969, partial [Ilyonectria robusta]|uniref:uncharacterized protein n=1 Tax=Ilyonectria robusta TaxID=1079257 RepID=UPI001E8ED8BF
MTRYGVSWAREGRGCGAIAVQLRWTTEVVIDAILVGLFAAIFGRAAHTKASQLTFGFVTFFWWPGRLYGVFRAKAKVLWRAV